MQTISTYLSSLLSYCISISISFSEFTSNASVVSLTIWLKVTLRNRHLVYDLCILALISIPTTALWIILNIYQTNCEQITIHARNDCVAKITHQRIILLIWNNLQLTVCTHSFIPTSDELMGNMHFYHIFFLPTPQKQTDVRFNYYHHFHSNFFSLFLLWIKLYTFVRFQTFPQHRIFSHIHM